jgi:hypothetical protein
MSELQLEQIDIVDLPVDQEEQVRTHRTYSFQWRGDIRDHVEQKACEEQLDEMQNTELVCRVLDRDSWRVTICYVEEALVMLNEIGHYTVEDNSWISSDEMENVHRAEQLLIDMLDEWSCVQVERGEFGSYEVSLDRSVDYAGMIGG